MNNPDLIIPFVAEGARPFNLVLSDSERGELQSKLLALFNEGATQSELRGFAETYFGELIRSDPGRI